MCRTLICFRRSKSISEAVAILTIQKSGQRGFSRRDSMDRIRIQ